MGAADSSRVAETCAAEPCASLNGHTPSAGALKVLRILEDAGYEAWVVGGWVRDALMDLPDHDVDLTCSAPWQESERVLGAAGVKVVESGTRFGGITAIADGEQIEVTTYRVDGFYSDGRHPDEVRFASTVEEDLGRRDFTVNAMAWHPERGLLDLYHGEDDIRARLIRAVGDPRRRFEEDALRMLRAVRFACRLDFKIEKGTADALAACAPLLSNVASERIGHELDEILATGHGGDAMANCPEVICAAVPELEPSRGFDQRTPYHAYDVYTHVLRVLTVAGELALADAGPGERPSRSLMWAAFLHDVGKPETFTVDENGRGHFYGHPAAGERIARKVMRRLGLPARLVAESCLLIRYHDTPVKPDRTALLKMLANFSAEGLDTRRLTDELMDLKRADALGKAPGCFDFANEIEEMRAQIHGLLDEGAAYSVRTLAIRGSDLIERGIKPGPHVGQLLKRALSATLKGKVPNEREALLDYLRLDAWARSEDADASAAGEPGKDV